VPAPNCPLLTVDAVIVDPERGVALICRRSPPFAGCWALPGGFVEVGEECEAACVREVHEETGLDVTVAGLIGVCSRPDRDPRGHTVSVVYLCRASGGEIEGGDDAAAAAWFADVTGLALAFDHSEILAAVGFSTDPPQPQASRPARPEAQS